MPGRGFIVGAPVTGSGKTSITLGLLRAFSRRGINVAPAKVGPDYIDPRFHEASANRTSVNLDGWAMRPALLKALAGDVAASSDLAIVEGVMGLHDGAPRPKHPGQGTTAEIARLTGWPVVLVVDGSRMAQSVAPLVMGFRDFDPAVTLAGVILNKTGGEKHQHMLSSALDGIGIQVLGIIPRNEDVALPSRHLGLIQAEEQSDLGARIDRLADLVETHVDLDAIEQAAKPLTMDVAPEATTVRLRPFGQRIALADDVAFRFVYPHLVNAWRDAGAEVIPFSPLTDEPPAAHADAVYLPGGYPELHGGTLAAAAGFKAGMRAAAEAGIPVFGECGGYMVLGETIVDADGASHEMTGLVGVETSFADRALHIGYREVEARAGFAAGEKGAKFNAHEFHYATILRETGEPLFDNHTDGSQMGLRSGSVAGSFAHLIDIAEF